MAIHSDDPAVVAKSSKYYLTPQKPAVRRGLSPSGDAAQIKTLTDKVAGMEQIGLQLWQEILDKELDSIALQNKIVGLEDGDNLVEQVNAYADFVEQFQALCDQDRDGIQASAKELGIEVKGNAADRDVLSACFKIMCEKMLVTDAPSEEE